MSTTVLLFLIGLVALSLCGPLVGMAAVKRAYPFLIENGHLVAGRVVSKRYPLGDIDRVVFSAEGSERARYVGVFVVRTRQAGSSGKYVFSVDNIRFRRAPREELEAYIETLRKQLADSGIASEYRG